LATGFVINEGDKGAAMTISNVVSLSSHMEGDMMCVLSLYRMAQRRPGHICHSPMEASTEEDAMAALGTHPYLWQRWALRPFPRDKTAFKTSASKGREVT
jgi:hypothetical protein